MTIINGIIYATGLLIWIALLALLILMLLSIIGPMHEAAIFTYRVISRNNSLHWTEWWKIIPFWWHYTLNPVDSVHFEKGGVVYWPGFEPR